VLHCDHLGIEIKRFKVIKKEANKAAKQLIHISLNPPIKLVKLTAGNRKITHQNVHRCNRDNGSRIFSLICSLKNKALSKFQPMRIVDHVISVELFFCPVAYFIAYKIGTFDCSAQGLH
jgi:Cu2+-containing amine oxidase